uniref:Uncharacterized protein n=1 Tax=Sarcophilus harrisii TaxID=9305 RepID=A0A7N4NTE7_SARHA
SYEQQFGPGTRLVVT